VHVLDLIGPRAIVQEGDDLYVVTHGYGTGVLPSLNETNAPGGWKPWDFNIRAELNNKRPLGYPMDELNAIARSETPLVVPDRTAQDDRPELRNPPPIFFPPY